MKVILAKLNYEYIKRKKTSQFYIKKKLFKTLSQNQNQNVLKRTFFNLSLTKKNHIISYTRHINKCNLTARARAYQKDFGYSRHKLKQQGLHGNLPCIILKSW